MDSVLYGVQRRYFSASARVNSAQTTSMPGQPTEIVSPDTRRTVAHSTRVIKNIMEPTAPEEAGASASDRRIKAGVHRTARRLSGDGRLRMGLQQPGIVDEILRQT